ncbi:MAG: hypothetical protein IPG67_01315 [Acidobacteria bacterium]|nr:hypothetical protein [Acidobacteriota bacterium]
MFQLISNQHRVQMRCFFLGGREFGWAGLRSDLLVAVEIGPRLEIAGIAFGGRGLAIGLA